LAGKGGDACVFEEGRIRNPSAESIVLEIQTSLVFLTLHYLATVVIESWQVRIE